jgi:alcohol dehydrogenase (cytochrome c)
VSAQQAPAIFTAAQATRGQAVYDAKCAACHGAQLEGKSASALTGPRFATKWANGNHSVDDLYFITRTQMPYGAGGTLSNQQYIDSVAYILKANGYRAGDRELPANSDALKRIRIESIAAAAVKDQPPAASPAEQASGAQPSLSGPTQEELNAAAANTSDWLTSNHDYGGQRYVDLKQINVRNASSLRPACIYQTGDTKPFHNNPLVYKGIMYITTSQSTMAIDATNCRVKWRNDRRPKSLEVYPPNRGAAIKEGRLVRATTDGFLFALDMETGKLLWEKKLIATDRNEGSFNGAPVVFGDLIILGVGISEQGVRGWVGAFKLSDGSPVWKFNTIPDTGEPGADTWGTTEDARLRGGGAVWAPMSLDHQRGLLYVPVANPAPDFYGLSRPGLNLYTNSMVVLDIRTGKLQWYYQATPHDTHDYDITQVSPLFTMQIGDKQRNLVTVAGKDGLLHVLDRDSKEHLYSAPITTRENAEKEVTKEGLHTCPGVLGGSQWNGAAFNPRTSMLYMPAVDWCGVFKRADEAKFVPGQIFMGGSHQFDPVEKARGWLTAIDAASGRIAWKYESKRPMTGAVTTTSGDVVFTGELTGDMITLDAKTGKVLYRFNTGGPINGGVISYGINNKQYVAVASGSSTGFWMSPPAASTIVIFSLP